MQHAESAIALEMLKEQKFYNYYIGDINVYTNTDTYNGNELAKSAVKRLNLYYFNYAILPQLKAQSTKYIYNIDGTTNRHEENVELMGAAQEAVSLVIASSKRSVTINVNGTNKVFTAKDLSKKILKSTKDQIISELQPYAIADAKQTITENGIIPAAVVEFMFRELALIDACKEYFQPGGAAGCYTALGAAALSIVNDGYTSWVLAGEIKELNTNTIIHTYLSDYFNFAADYNKIFTKWGVTNLDGVLTSIATNGGLSTYDDLTSIKNKIVEYQLKVYNGTDDLFDRFNLDASASIGSLDTKISDGVELISNGDGTGTLTACYSIKNNSYYQVEDAAINLSLIPDQGVESVVHIENSYTFTQYATENICSEFKVSSVVFSEIIANPYILKLSVVYGDKVSVDTRVLESSLQNEMYDLIRNTAKPILKLNLPVEVYSNSTVLIDAFGTYSLISGDTFTYQWEFLSFDKAPSLVINNATSSQISFAGPSVPQGKDSLEIKFRVTATSDTSTKSSSNEFIVKVLANNIVETPSLQLITESHVDGCSKYSQENCGYILKNVSNLTKLWTFKNNGNINLQNIALTLLDDSTGGISYQQPTINMTNLNVDENLIINMNLSVPPDLIDGQYSSKWRISTDNGYETIAYFKFNLERGIFNNIIDSTKPTILFSNTDNDSYSSGFNLNVSAADDVALKLVAGVVLNDLGASTDIVFSRRVSEMSVSESFYIDISSLAVGDYKVKLTALDENSNQSDYVFYNFSKFENSNLYDPGWGGNIEFLGNNNTIIPAPNNAKIRITPDVEQVENSWGGLVVQVEGNGEWNTSPSDIDPSHYTTSNTYQFVVFDDVNSNNQWDEIEKSYGGFTSNNPSSAVISDFNGKTVTVGYGEAATPSFDFSGVGVNPGGLYSPNGGETWQSGTTYSIQWDTSKIIGSFVNVYVLHDDPTDLPNYANDLVGLLADKYWYHFGSNISNTGNYDIDAAALNGNGNAYAILIVSNSGSNWDVSNGIFTLSQ